MKLFLHCEGGLGNQLFQYALARSLAIKTGAQLVLDTWETQRGRSRPVVLDKFKIQARFATPMESARCRFVDSPRTRRIAGFFHKWMPGLVPDVVRRRTHGFDPSVFEMRKTTFLEGWFQSELYFRENGDLIRRELELRQPPSEENRKCLEQITSSAAVSVHVRRGDYVSNAYINKRIGTCGLDYYRAAIELMRQRVASPTFFVFSDDPQWTRENLDVPEPRFFISHNCNVADWEDIRLMSACRHFVIANSTFSWWGAWLGAGADKIVIAPKVWFVDPSVSTKDIVPESWIRV